MVNSIEGLMRELRFTLQDKVIVATLIISALLSTVTIINGHQESVTEEALIERVEELVNQDREFTLASQGDAGSAAYDAFHFTYDPPKPLAFAARGVRDDLPWKHRIRMLALEGQIYETDTGNPELSRIGKLDFSFIVAFLLPLFSILLLYDLHASEARNNRWAFLSATSGNGRQLLRHRSALRSLLLYICVAIPFIIGAIINNASFENTVLVLAAIALNIVIWFSLALLVASRVNSGPTVAALLLATWFVIAVTIPVAGKLIIENTIKVPEGGEILLTQRETVNDAWDLPKAATMEPFVARHPEWVNDANVNQPFEWKWYYAFQQVGDQSVERESENLRVGIAQRDKAMGLVSLMSPSLLATRLLSHAANTNIAAFQRYDACVRDFHTTLRRFYYPMLFGRIEYSNEHMLKVPQYSACHNAA